ncbi:hypothetical protein GCM10028801_44930 [Nocardioides maradonensis]
MSRPTPKKSALSGSPIAPPSAAEPSSAPPRPTAEETGTAPAAPRRGKTIEEVAPYLFDKPTKKRKTTAEIAREKGKVPLGLYFPSDEALDEARRAFVTDFWEHDGVDTFSEWVSQAILTHASLGYNKRAALAQPRRERRAGVKGKLRKIDVRREVSDAVDKGITEDREQLRRQITISTWCNDAIVAAVNATKARTNGDLMEIDGQLPPRLRK